MFGGVFHDFLNLDWVEARGYLAEELSQLRTALNAQWGNAFSTENNLTADAIEGNASIVPRYVANTGVDKAPKWDVIALGSSAMSGRLPFTHIATLAASKLAGRGSGAGTGDIEPITLGPSLTMTGTTLSVNSASLTPSIARTFLLMGA